MVIINIMLTILYRNLIYNEMPFRIYFIFTFSFSSWLLKNTVLTLDAMMTAFESCYTPSPHSARTSDLYDIATWLYPHLDSMSGHSGPHCFKIVRGDNGKAYIYFRQFMTSKVIIY